MNKYCFVLKLIESYSKQENKEINVTVKDHNIYYARKNIQIQYPEYKIVNLKKDKNEK